MSEKVKKKGAKPAKDTHDEVEIEYLTETKKPSKETKARRDSLKQLRGQIKKKDEEIERLKKELEALKEEYLRKAAEMENLRKRLDREKTEYYQYALSDFLLELLGVLDNFERALESPNQGEEDTLRQGVEMIYKQLLGLILKQGVSPIEISEKKFDPHLHQAFLTEESEKVKEPQVAEELQKGYTLHNRLLRPSLVKVVVPKKEQ